VIENSIFVHTTGNGTAARNGLDQTAEMLIGMWGRGDISINAPEFSAIAVDWIDLELRPYLDWLALVGGQNVDRQAWVQSTLQ